MSNLAETQLIDSSNSNSDDADMIRRAWSLCISFFQEQLDSQLFNAYIKPLVVSKRNSLDTTETVELRIYAPSILVRNIVERDFSETIKTEFFKLAPNIQLSFHVSPQENQEIYFSPNNPDTEIIQAPLLQLDTQDEPFDLQSRSSLASSSLASSSRAGFSQEQNLGFIKNPLAEEQKVTINSSSNSFSQSVNPRYTFDSFVVGNSNEFCNAAALRVAENPGGSYNPLFIYGGVGLGKTHLLHSIGNKVVSFKPDAKVIYISSEAFTNELIQALRHAKMDEFKARLRNIDVLLIDDIQFISGKERTQEEFFHTFNALYNSKRQIVLTSDKIPSEISGIEERLQTRFSWGLTADLQAPDYETRVAILKRKATLEEFELPEEVAQLLAERISSNVRELEGALTRLNAMASIKNIPITLSMAMSSLEPMLQPKKIRVSIEDIKKVVAQHFSIKVSEIVSKRRTKNLSFPRHVAMYLCRKHTTASYPEIGSQFGGRDHSSVIHASNVVSTKVTEDSSVRSLIGEIERLIFDL
jgi:chromosomal replication initiator protein